MKPSPDTPEAPQALTFDPELDTHNFPPVQPGGSLLVAWQVKNKPVLVVGGGAVAAGRILSLLNASAYIHLVSPAAGLTPEVVHRINTCADRITYYNRTFAPSLLDDIQPCMVLTAIDDPKASTEIYQLCHARRIPINVADVPPECDFYFGSIHRNGPLQIMVSTNGNGPKIANLVRREIANTLPENVGEAVVRVGVLRRELRKVAPRIEDGERRMRWMSRVCERWTLEEMCEMGEREREGLLKGYLEDRVPSFKELTGREVNGKRLGRGARGGAEEKKRSWWEEWWSEDEGEGPDENGVFREALEGSFGWM